MCFCFICVNSMLFLGEPNIALGRPTYLSSIFDAALSAGVAVDGDRDGDYKHKSCSSTKFQTVPSPWWAVDLGRETSVLKVTISNRVDCCREFSVVLCGVIRDNTFELNNVLAISLHLANYGFILLCYDNCAYNSYGIMKIHKR